MSSKFQRKIENFTCEHCGTVTIGNGYTNHCPHCLHSKHVDINPGDRACKCHGLMIPTSVETKKGGYVINFECQKCGSKKRNKSAANDNFEAILEIMRKGR